MENTNLKQAIAAIYDIELNNYLMTRAIQSLNEAQKKSPLRPADYDCDKPCKPKEPYAPVSEGVGTNAIAAVIIGAICGAVVKFIVGIIQYLIAYNKAPEGGQDAVVDIAPSIIFGGFWLWVAIFAAIGLIIGVFIGISSNKEYKKKQRVYEAEYEKYNRALKEYELDYAKYEKNKKLAECDWEAKCAARRSALLQQKEQLRTKMQESNVLLNDLYNTVGIDVKFRNIIPMAYMNEFLKLSISTKLEGADGLYYLVMKELRMDQMQYKLDTIITKLDTLIDQQHSIYGELLNLNMKCDNMISNTVRQTDALLAHNNLINDQNALLTQIESNTALAAYNAERVAKEQEYQSYMIRYQSW